MKLLKNMISIAGADLNMDGRVTKKSAEHISNESERTTGAHKAYKDHSARFMQKLQTGLGAGFSLVLAGTLALGVCGVSPAQVSALTADGKEASGVSESGLLGAGNPGTGAPDTGSPIASAAVNASDGEINDTPKEEVVYARLSVAGGVDNVYVVNVLKPNTPGQVVDYGPYTAVQDLTDASGVSRQGDMVSVDVVEDSLSYQGDMGAAALPWDVSIVYELDGKKVEASELGGASGNLTIEIATKQNPSVDPSFFENYLLQITVPFVSSQVTNVSTDDGQIALAGSNTQVTFMGMPGKEGTFKVEAQVKGFTMSGITLAAVPFAMGIEKPDTAELVSGFSQLASGVGELKAGADALAGGANGLAVGINQVTGGMGGLSAGAGQLVGGANDLTQGVQGVAGGASLLLGGMQTYQQALLDQALGATSMIDQSAAQAAQGEYENAQAAFTQAYLTAYNTRLAADIQTNLASGMALDAALNAAMGTAAGAAQTDSSVLAAQAALESATQNLVAINATNTAYGASAQALSGAAEGLGSATDAQSLMGGVAALSSGAESLASGTSEFAAGASAFASGANQAASGAGQLAVGANQLSLGASQLASGTGVLYEEVQGIPAKVQEEIDAMMASYDKSDFEPVSFTSSKNTNVSLVQFVMTTDPIETPQPEESTAEEPEQGIWERVLALFGLA